MLIKENSIPFVSSIDRDIVPYADDQDIQEVKITSYLCMSNHANSKTDRVEPEAT